MDSISIDIAFPGEKLIDRNAVKFTGLFDRNPAAAHGFNNGDIVTIASFLLFGLVKDQPFGGRSTRTGLALTLAFLLRNGAAVAAPDEELAGVAIGIAAGEVYAGMVEMWLRDSARPIR